MSISQSISLALLPGTIASILVFILSPAIILIIILWTIISINNDKRKFRATHIKSDIEAELVELNKKLTDLQNDRINRIKTGLDITGTDALIDSCKFNIERKQKVLNFYYTKKLRY